MLRHTGFTEVRWGKEVDVFAGSKHESDAKDFDTRGVTIFARKPAGPSGARTQEDQHG